jgi:hypothetical protein
MKKRYARGGLTQADIDAGLTQADVDAGLRGGRNERISDEDRTRAIMNASRDGESIVDRYRDLKKNPEAQSIPVDMGGRRDPRAASRPAPRVRPSAMAEEGPSPVPGTQMAETEPGATMPRRPSRGSYDRPGPIGDLINLIRGRVGTPSPYRRGTRTEAEDIPGAKRGGSVKKMVKKASSASKRADGIATKGKTKGRMI